MANQTRRHPAICRGAGLGYAVMTTRYLVRANGCRSTHAIADLFLSCYGINMRGRPKVYSASPVTPSDFASTQKARVAARESAENERAQKRRDSDARLDVNASKWRYVCTSN